MTLETQKSQREIFAAALECPDAEERARLLDEECGGDHVMRDELETLLDEHSDLGTFMDVPAAGGESSVLEDHLVGKTIDAFTLVELIGEGGGGSVYLANQLRPVRREVAFKILKLGLDTKSVIGRFEAERQTLARMDHPHIASVIDAGASGDGRPYFVMEYVPGVPVTEFCDERNLSIKNRLTVFIRICRAIEHAHQKGVIHRDLKPSNILIREQEGQFVPKVIDFGVSKAISSIDDEPNGFTINEAIIGTPAYMSPEQASRGERDIDTRVDVYSLGVILYELLTGSTPMKATTCGMSGKPQVLKILSEVDPPRPSVFLRNRGTEELRSIGGQREIGGQRLTSELQGDLDWIAMKCLEKDRTRRYGSASELGRDIELYLSGKPVTARPPTWTYRTKKYISRNRVPVAFAGGLLATLITVAVMSVIFGLRATKAEETEIRLRSVAEKDRELAMASVDEARHHQYVGNINLANQALIEGHVSNALFLLEPWADLQPGESDLRGFEWYYLMEKCKGDEHESLPKFDDPIDALALSPDGNQLAISSGDRLHLWSISRGHFVATLIRHAEHLEFSPAGDRLLASGKHGIAVINVDSWDVPFELDQANDQRATFSPDGRQLATSGRNGVIIWSTEDWRRLTFLRRAHGALAYAPDGSALASQTNDGITIWPMEPDREPVNLEDAPGLVIGDRQIHWSSDGRFLFLAQNESPTDSGYALAIWETEGGREVATMPLASEGGLHTGVISSISRSGDGSLMATSSWDHSVRLWDFASGSLKRRLLGHRGEVWSVAISREGDFIASGSKDGEVNIWPVEQLVKEDLIAENWVPLGFSGNSEKIAAYNRRGVLGTFDVATGRKIHSQLVAVPSFKKPPGSPVPGPGGLVPWRAVSICQNMRILAEDRGDGSIVVHDLDQNSEIILDASKQRIESLIFSPDGGSLVATSKGAGLTWWDLDRSGETKEIISDSGAIFAQFSADGSTLITRHRDGSATIWDVELRSKKHQFQLGKLTRGEHLALSADGSLIAMTGGIQDYQNLISLRETATGQEVGSLSGHKQGIWSLAFSPDGKTLASFGSERVIRLWKIETRSELLTLKEPEVLVSDLAFSPNGRVLISSSSPALSEPKIRIFRGSQ